MTSLLGDGRRLGLRIADGLQQVAHGRGLAPLAGLLEGLGVPLGVLERVLLGGGVALGVLEERCK